MTVKNFFYGLIASFGIPWLVVIAIPFIKMRTIEPVEFDEIADGTTGIYHPKHQNAMGAGAQIYGQEGCATCHSQVSRPTYAGNDVFQTSLAGISDDSDRGDTRRETNLWDYPTNGYAWIGETRIGPDLGNFGRRMDILAAKKNEELAAAYGVKVEELKSVQRFSPTLYVLTHLFNPRLNPDAYWSTCPSNPQMFETIKNYGQGTALALPVESKGSDQDELIVPNDKALQMASYLLSLKRDGEVPYSINYRRDKVKASEKK